MFLADVHRDCRERRTNGHAYEAPDEPLAMKALPLGAQLVQHVCNPALSNQGWRIEDLHLVGALDLVIGVLGRQGRDGLEAPFLVGYPPKGLVPVLDNCVLPA